MELRVSCTAIAEIKGSVGEGRGGSRVRSIHQPEKNVCFLKASQVIHTFTEDGEKNALKKSWTELLRKKALAKKNRRKLRSRYWNATKIDFHHTSLL